MGTPWVTVRAVRSTRSTRGAIGGVSVQLFHEMQLLTNSLTQNLREEAPVNKSPNAKNRGALRASIRASLQTNGSQWRISFSANDYVKYVINKTRPHRITAKPGHVLAFNWNGQRGVSRRLAPISHSGLGLSAGSLGRRGGPSILRAPAGHAALKGGMVFVHFVKHPGTKANDFVSRAVDKTMQVGTPGFTARVQAAIANDILDAMPVTA